jgi:hypothetical protein
MKIVKSVMLIVLVLCGLMISRAAAEDSSFENRDYDLGITLGMWFPGSMSIDIYWPSVSFDVDKSGSLLVRAFADMYVASKFAVGVYGNYSKFEVKNTDYASQGLDSTMYEIGVSLKPRFLLSPSVALKPGLNIGYRSTTFESFGLDVDLSADGLAIDLGVELQIALDGGYMFHIEGGFLSQPVGGSDDFDLAWAPIMYLGAGITF